MLDSGDGTTDPPTPSRRQPAVHSVLFQGLLRHLGASLESNLPPKTFTVGCAWELQLVLERGSLSILVPPESPSPGIASPASPSSDTISDEPTLKDLIQFSETLREKKAVLYASSKGSFAHHLTSYLTAWGLDVSHVSSECGVEESPDQPRSQATESDRDRLTEKPPTPSYTSGLDTFAPAGGSSANIGGQVQEPQTLSFILVDDDVDVLRERLRAFHAEQPQHFHLNLRKQSWAANQRRLPHHSHRTPRPFESSSLVIMHFTSLANFKLVKDTVYSASIAFTSLSTLPEVMIVPKPAGPRRFLTALYTAVKKPMVDPYFSPIATSPTTPSSHLRGSFLHPHPNLPKSPTSRPPGTRSNSERSFRSAKDIGGEYPGFPLSPLSVSDASKEYFPETAVKLGPSASSGLVVQSLDGQPAGIVFQPRARSPRKSPATHTTERERNQSFLQSSKTVSSPRRLDGDSRSPLGNASIPTILAIPISPQRSQSDIQESAEGESPTGGAKGKGVGSGEAVLSDASPAPSPPTPKKPDTLGEIPRRATYTSAISSVQRLATVKRPSIDKAASVPPGASRTGKGLADANVVPPISVLIVDGAWQISIGLLSNSPYILK
jgi:osomolarity two-component system response regulator SSK1